MAPRRAGRTESGESSSWVALQRRWSLVRGITFTRSRTQRPYPGDTNLYAHHQPRLLSEGGEGSLKTRGDKTRTKLEGVRPQSDYRSARGRLVVVGLAPFLLMATLVESNAYPRPGATAIVSISSDGSPNLGEIDAVAPAVSSTGRYIAFASDSLTLVTPDANPGPDIFVHDRSSGETELASISSSGLQGHESPLASKWRPDISANGRYIVFTSDAPDLVVGDTNMTSDVFVRDRKTGETKLISASSTGEPGDGSSRSPTISNDGRYIAYTSLASNIAGGDSDEGNVLVYDQEENQTMLASLATNEDEAFGYEGVIDASGRYVVFNSYAANLPSGGEERVPPSDQVFVRDLEKGETEMVSLNIHGSQSLGASCPCDISAGGQDVAFVSSKNDQVPNDTHPAPAASLYFDVFVHNRESGRTRRVSVTSFGEQTTDGHSGRYSGSITRVMPPALGLSISNDGTYVAFGSIATNLFPGDRESHWSAPLMLFGTSDADVFVHDMRTGSTELVSIDKSGHDGRCAPLEELTDVLPEELPSPLPDLATTGDADRPTISGNGRFVGFASCNVNLTSDDSLGGTQHHAYVRDRGLRLATNATSLNVPSDTRQCTAPKPCGQQTVVSVTDKIGDGVWVASIGRDGTSDLMSSSLAYRPQYQDVFVGIEMEHMPHVLPSPSPVFYGLRFEVEDKSYEARATSLLGGTFGLFDCANKSVCIKIADLRGGYGTTGQRVVFSMPLDQIGLENGGEPVEIEAFSALGSYFTGPTKVLDTVRIN